MRRFLAGLALLIGCVLGAATSPPDNSASAFSDGPVSTIDPGASVAFTVRLHADALALHARPRMELRAHVATGSVEVHVGDRSVGRADGGTTLTAASSPFEDCVPDTRGGAARDTR
jgi:hypothetical protein